MIEPAKNKTLGLSDFRHFLPYFRCSLDSGTWLANQNESLASLKADIDSYINQYGAQVMTGAIDLDGSWEDYVSTMEAMGAPELYKIYKKAFDQAKEK